MSVIKIGNYEVDKDLFIKAVAENNSLTKILETVGIHQPLCTRTRNNIRKLIVALNLPDDHIKPKKQANKNLRIKYNLSNDNRIYYFSFIEASPEKTKSVYKSNCGLFLESLGSKDLMTITVDEILEYVEIKQKNAANINLIYSIRAMLIYCIYNDINDAKEKVDKEMLFWLIKKPNRRRYE